MGKNILHMLDLWLEKRIFYPGYSNKQIYVHKSAWKNTAFAFIHTFVITVGLLIFAPQATLFIHYGYTMLILFTVILSLFLVFPRLFISIGFVTSIGQHLVTFYYIFLLGGIPTSGGLIFVGIANVIASVTRQKTWYSIILLTLYIVLVIVMVVLKPWLHVPDQITPGLNSLAYMINIILLSGPVLVFVLYFIRQQQKFEELETKHLKEINEMKGRLFTNITHEFRTPLTIIQGMADLIRTQPEQWTETGTQKIKTNSNILLRMVNQMLGLAKIDAGAITVNLIRRDINKYLAYLVRLFESEALKRKIDLQFASAGNPFEMDFDTDKLMHIITNLVSNALKFTPQGGRVEVSTSVTDNGNMFSIRVKDTGIGINKEHLSHLFDRFYQVESITSLGGTGLGLAFTKEMVELLKGSISVESIPGISTEFTVTLPVTLNAPTTDLQEPYQPQQSLEELDSVGVGGSTEAPLLLIVEDNSDVVQYLHAILKTEYRVEVAGNGSVGVEKALELIPDIILSDVMMPVMDGIGLLERVKNDIRTSHIPVVMLTATADIDSRLDGLERGADAYLAKPFDEKELHIQLKNLVELRKKLFERYASLEKIPETSDTYLQKEDEFMIQVKQVLEANLQDDEFGISQLCHELAVSHAQLYRKFRSLSNRTIADYFKSLRLSKAKELLLTTNLNVTVVTFTVGFKSLSYFSREFTREFGKPPSEFRK
jgi:signal transduction histidine kinase/DNA-binding response OmpR family regulator